MPHRPRTPALCEKTRKGPVALEPGTPPEDFGRGGGLPFSRHPTFASIRKPSGGNEQSEEFQQRQVLRRGQGGRGQKAPMSCRKNFSEDGRGSVSRGRDGRDRELHARQCDHSRAREGQFHVCAHEDVHGHVRRRGRVNARGCAPHPRESAHACEHAHVRESECACAHDSLPRPSSCSSGYRILQDPIVKRATRPYTVMANDPYPSRSTFRLHRGAQGHHPP